MQMAAAIQASVTSADILGPEAPCRVKLRLWRVSDKPSHLRRASQDVSAAIAPPGASSRVGPRDAGGPGGNLGRGLTLEAALLTIPDAVLCSEMGVHFSPCGRFLAACIVCVQVRSAAAAPSLLVQSSHKVSRFPARVCCCPGPI